jgi:hypothetical protein
MGLFGGGSSAKLMVQIVGESASAVTAFSKTTSAAKTTDKAVGKTGTSITGIAKAVATGYAVKKVVEFGKSSVDAAGASIKANKLLVQEFKNVGDETGTLAKHAIDLAESLGRQIGVSPTVIKGAEGILTTFHAVSDQTAVNAGIFDRATKAAADLSAAGFGDMSGNAKLLGKALQDPTQGMGTLRRAGVNLSKAQQDQIKNMQKSGDLMGAQKTLLGEVENQVKGTAAATAGSGAKMQVAYEEMKVQIGTALLPAITQVRKSFSGLFTFISANATWLVPVTIAVAGFIAVLLTISKVVGVIEDVKKAIAGFKAAWAALNASFIASPIGLIILAIIVLVAALVILYLKVDWFRAFVDAAMRDIVNFFQAGWDLVIGIFNAVVGFIKRYMDLILVVMFGPFAIVFLLIKAAITGGWSGILAQFGKWISDIRGILSPILGVIVGPFVAAWGWIYAGLISPVIGAFTGVASAISSALSGVTNAITKPFTAAWDFVRDHVIQPLKDAWNTVARAINAIHVSFTIPSNVITDALKIGGKGFDWSPPFNLPILQSGGLITRTGLVLAHAGEAITPLPARARSGPLVEIAHAHFSEKIDVETFGRRLAWTMQTAVA